jgi:hypothetical protein
MGYAVGSQCFGTVDEAASQACASYPVTSASGGVVTSWSCSGAAGATLTLVRTDSTGAAPVTSTLDVSFPTCDPSAHYSDMLALWGALVAAAALLWALKAFVLRNITASQ